MQLNLTLADLPPDDSQWEQLDETTRQAVIDRLTQAIAKVVTGNEPPHRESADE
ncbi:hypothetical protein [Pseudomonas borbori]|uniref:Uncharacterized protein n=1 Tax=Pseudomonas borbori TaxID=289003 RepID=A0A1I5XMI3_9PSED|nr:hypothetical protein [Pseudomonas borbori]SFQ33193.1 hypothetical protein SAMN05216190_1684 [Pseudomonas borbori]